MSAALLPEGFDALAPFVTEWAIDNAFKRDAARGTCSLDARQAFYDAFSPRLAEALDRLDRTPLAEHSPAERNLMLMALSYAHVAQSIEVHGPDEARHTRYRQRIPITRAPADA